MLVPGWGTGLRVGLKKGAKFRGRGTSRRENAARSTSCIGFERKPRRLGGRGRLDSAMRQWVGGLLVICWEWLY
jgi:hypothetical protein